MAFINKLVIACTGETPITYDINYSATNFFDIDVILASIPSELGTYTYTYATNGAGVPTIILDITGATCTPYFYVDGVPYSSALDGGAGQYIIGEGITPLFNLEYSISSDEFIFNECCDDCKSPQFVNDIYEGDTFIPYSLSMIDGTVVSVDSLGGDTLTFSERGCIELATPLIAGQEIRLKANDCESYSPIYKVKSKPQDCDFAPQIPCFIKVLNIKVRTVNEIYGKIDSLNTSSYGELKYRIDNGDWVDSWTELGQFPLNSGVTLGIKSKSSPTCKIEYPLLVIQKFA